MSVAVGLDVGTSSTKGVAIDSDGAVLAVASHEYPVSAPRPGWSEQDPELWWRAARRVLDELEAVAGAPSGIGLSGQMHGLVALDDAGAPVRPALLWNDQRTEAEAAEITAALGGEERVVALTGAPALTGFTAPKLLWMERHEPALRERVARVMLPKDYVRLKLTGEWATDVSDASGTTWFDVGARDWSAEVLGALGIDRALLPPALESAAVSGRTAAGVPVAAGAGDQAAGALGVGVGIGVAAAEAPASIVLGTSGVVLTALDGYAADARVQASCHAVAGRWFAMGVMLSAAGSLQWLHDVVDRPYEALLHSAERHAPGAEGLMFLPYLTGERSPHADPGARGSFTGLSVRHDRGALARAVLEGVAFGLCDVLDAVSALGARPAVGRVSGGGARSPLWRKIVASVLDLPLQRVAVEEGAALGAAMLGGVAGGLWSSTDEAISACVTVTDTDQPDPTWRDTYAELRPRFQALYPALRALQ